MPMPPFNQRLTLVAWFARQLGYSDNAEMLEALRECKEDWEDGRHPVLKTVSAQKGVRLPGDLLAEMDNNIHADLQKINASRNPPITLKYFQYLAALAVEYFLLRKAEDPEELLRELRAVAAAAPVPANRYPAPEGIDDLNKLALWMATGAGKTLLMHLNYHQFMRRRADLFAPDNIILLTPNETLSAQHLSEMRESGIPCFRYDEGDSGSGLSFGGGAPVRVLELTKLTADENSTRGGVSVPTSVFDGRNLLFVDEGHKGVGGEAWEARKRELANGGFKFEYSATYGQAFKRASAGKASEREDEYARSIAFDYSYRHFHGDGYGKDFDVVNLSGEPSGDKRDVLMLGNLLVFLQQCACFAENRAEFAQHNIEPPLLLLLGTTVTGGTKEAEQGRTDIVDYMRFLNRVAEDQSWSESAIGEITRGETGIKDDRGRDVFHERLNWLIRQCGGNPDSGAAANPRRVYDALLRHVFRADEPGALQFCPIHGVKDEVALRVSGGVHFGLIYVGKGAVPKLRDLLEEACPGIKSFDETITRPMFHNVANADSPVNILIGAKKFMEGWSSWRVSGMGLLHVGKSEGPLIIQLFGRGVRLKGAGMSLKRGGGDNPLPDPKQSLLETMNIFGIRADFISNFRAMLEREGAWEETLRLPVSPPPDKALGSGLMVPEYPAAGFTAPVTLVPDGKIRVQLDLSSSALRTRSRDAKTEKSAAAPPRSEASALSAAALNRVDWNAMHRDLQEYRARAGLWNLVIKPRNLRDIVSGCCAVVHDVDAPLAPTSDRELRRIRNAVFALLRKYADRFYNRRRSVWARENLSYQAMKSGRFALSGMEVGYTLSIRVDQKPENKELFEKLQELIANEEQLKRMWQTSSDHWDNDPPPRVYFDRHLYQPLLLANNLEEEGIRISPPGLNSGEKDFIKELESHVRLNPLSADEEIYLLRNQPRTGVGFHSDAGNTFPDFILWHKRGDQQRIVFVDPHGMGRATAYRNDPKARLHETLALVNQQMAKQHPNVTMDSYIVSQTPFHELREDYEDGTWDKEKFSEKHILFPQDDKLIATILADG